MGGTLREEEEAQEVEPKGGEDICFFTGCGDLHLLCGTVLARTKEPKKK